MFCMNHDEPCPLPCSGCEADCLTDNDDAVSDRAAQREHDLDNGE